jgi:hypothetical protein
LRIGLEQFSLVARDCSWGFLIGGVDVALFGAPAIDAFGLHKPQLLSNVTEIDGVYIGRPRRKRAR